MPAGRQGFPWQPAGYGVPASPPGGRRGAGAGQAPQHASSRSGSLKSRGKVNWHHRQPLAQSRVPEHCVPARAALSGRILPRCGDGAAAEAWLQQPPGGQGSLSSSTMSWIHLPQPPKARTSAPFSPRAPQPPLPLRLPASLGSGLSFPSPAALCANSLRGRT